MASEKGDLPHDTDSLPPHYASSDFTDSPPPAYRKPSTVRLQITRWICATILLGGFLTGTFILAHSYLHRPACQCPTLPQFENFPPPTSAALVQGSFVEELPSLNAVDNNLLMKQEKQEEEEPMSRQLDIPLPIEQGEVEEAMEKAIEEEVEELQNIVEEEEKKDIKLPMDMLLGNPALAGKDVECKVEKKIQNLGGGVLSKTIMVTCDDKDEEPTDLKVEVRPIGPIGGSFPRPPLSLLAPIFQMMKNRVQGRLERQMKPKIVIRRFPQPLGPFQQPFNGPLPGAHPVPFPFPSAGHQIENSFSQEQQQFPEPIPFPSASLIHPNMPEMEDNNEEIQEEEEEEEEPKNMLFREDFDRSEPELSLFSHQPQTENEPMLVQNDSPIKLFHSGGPVPFPEALKQILSKIESAAGQNNAWTSINSELPGSRSIDEMAPPKSKMLLPFPFRALKIQNRGARKLNIHEDFPKADSFDLPEAGPRAIGSPVTLPSPSEMRFFPGNFLRLPMPISMYRN